MSGPLPEGLLRLLREWLPSNDAVERPQMQLATVDEEGRPDLRTVLLSEWDEQGLVLHTDTGSRKAAHLRAHPYAAVLIVWPGFTRQLSVQGDVVPVEQEAAEIAYARRSPYLQQLAWQNTPAVAQLPRTERAAAWRRFRQEHDGAALVPPTSWGGFVVRPARVTFWESDADGPSHRVEHRRGADGSWSVHHLPG